MNLYSLTLIYSDQVNVLKDPIRESNILKGVFMQRSVAKIDRGKLKFDCSKVGFV